MVLPDFNSNYSNKKNPNFASSSDRFLAFFLDILLIFPFLYLVLSPLSRYLQSFLLYGAHSNAVVVLSGLIALGFVGLYFIISSLSLYFYKTTPGAYFFKLYLVSSRSESGEGAIEIGQVFTRQVIFCLEFFLLSLPLLEVVRHPQRLTWHDLASETRWATKKQDCFVAPIATEKKLATHLYVYFVFMFVAFGSIFLHSLFRSAISGDFDSALRSDLRCEQVDEQMSEAQVYRMDRALALYLVGDIGEACLKKEADYSLWIGNSHEYDWALFSKMVTSHEDDDFNSYLQEICRKKTTMCELAKASADMEDLDLEDLENQIRAQNIDSESIHIFLAQMKMNRGEYRSAAKWLADVPERYSSFKFKVRVRELYAENKLVEARAVVSSAGDLLSTSAQSELEAWMCALEVRKKEFSVCHQLENLVEKNPTLRENMQVATSLLRYRTSVKSLQHKVDEMSWWSDDPQWTELVKLSSLVEQAAQNRLAPEIRAERLLELAQHAGSHRVRDEALYQLSSITKDSQKLKSDIRKVWFAMRTRDLDWQALGVDLFGKKQNQLFENTRMPASVEGEEK